MEWAILSFSRCAITLRYVAVTAVLLLSRLCINCFLYRINCLRSTRLRLAPTVLDWKKALEGYFRGWAKWPSMAVRCSKSSFLTPGIGSFVTNRKNRAQSHASIQERLAANITM